MKKPMLQILVVLLILVMAGCSKAEPTGTPEPIKTDAPAPATEAPQPAVEQPTAASTVATEVATKAPTAPPINHLVIPGEPIFTFDQKVTDCDTGERIRLGATTIVGSGCDVWDKARFERPAAASNAVYTPALDIISASMASSNAFLFGRIVLYKDAAGAIPADLVAGFEIDTDIDSRGDYLILTTAIHSTEWTTDGVQVWQDGNGDVGGKKAHSPDGQQSDGYETLLFDAGQGNDPDLAWVRISPTDPSAIEIAFKTSLVPSTKIFAWWAWTSLGALDPAKMELVDLMKDDSTWNLDNTCAWIFNAKPTNLLSNICAFSYPTAVPTITPTVSVQGCPVGTYLDVGVCRTCAIPPVAGCPSSAATWNPSSCRCENIN